MPGLLPPLTAPRGARSPQKKRPNLAKRLAPHPAVQERNSLPELLPRGRPVEKNASFRRTQSEQLLADVSAKLKDCRNRLEHDPTAVARPDPPKDLPKVLGRPPRRESVLERVERRIACAALARDAPQAVPSPTHPRPPRIPASHYHDVQVVDVRRMRALQKRDEYYTGPRVEERGKELPAPLRLQRWLVHLSQAAVLLKAQEAVEEMRSWPLVSRRAARQIQRLWRQRRRRHQLLCTLMRGARVVGRLAVLRRRTRAATLLQGLMMGEGKKQLLATVRRLKDAVCHVQRFWRAVRWRHRLRACVVHTALLRCAADAAVVPLPQRARALRHWMRARYRLFTVAAAQCAAEQAEDDADADARAILGVSGHVQTAKTSLSVFWKDDGTLPDLLRRARKGEFRR